ncbi:MAG: phosphoribosyl-AMP cyclohydrolase [Pirellulaceae bacterium]|nr:phosphoribosyl-AMP cyclohydrolase [Pirellulaceae bacterium]
MKNNDLPDFDKGVNGLLPAIAQDRHSGEVLMVAYMNRHAFNETVRTGFAVYYSRSKNRLWPKGETSGHYQRVREILVDCDADTILLKVDQVGAACHQGYKSCFFRKWTPDGPETVDKRLIDPNEIYGEN